MLRRLQVGKDWVFRPLIVPVVVNSTIVPQFDDVEDSAPRYQLSRALSLPGRTSHQATAPWVNTEDGAIVRRDNSNVSGVLLTRGVQPTFVGLAPEKGRWLAKGSV